MKRFVWSIPLLLSAGCGLAPSAGPHACADDSTCGYVSTAADTATGAALVDPRSISTPVPEHRDVATSDPPADGSSAQLPLDPFTGFLVDAVGIDALLSLLFNDRAIDQLDPSGPRLNDSLTFLERLCREGDTPDFVCRDRYGN